jgi:hypothetical protein
MGKRQSLSEHADAGNVGARIQDHDFRADEGRITPKQPLCQLDSKHLTSVRTIECDWTGGRPLTVVSEWFFILRSRPIYRAMVCSDDWKENPPMFLRMKRDFILTLAACFALATCVLAFATSVQQGEKKAASKTVTGCLQKGDEADEFSLTGDDGKHYDLRSSALKLGDHVGHKVTVTGTFKPEGQEKEKDEAKEGGTKEAGDIQVKSLKMVSSSCQW